MCFWATVSNFVTIDFWRDEVGSLVGNVTDLAQESVASEWKNYAGRVFLPEGRHHGTQYYLKKIRPGQCHFGLAFFGAAVQ